MTHTTGGRSLDQTAQVGEPEWNISEHLGPARACVVQTLLFAQATMRRNLRARSVLVFSVLQPFANLCIFAAVFDPLIRLDMGISYMDYVVPTIVIQTLTFSSIATGAAVARDVTAGMITRYRTMPLARPAFLVGRVLGDLTRLLFQAAFVLSSGYLIGFQPTISLGLSALVPLVIVAYAFLAQSVAVVLGLWFRDPAGFQAAAMTTLLPVFFLSDAFAPRSLLPDWMQPIVQWSPVSAALDTLRGLMLGDGAVVATAGAHLSQVAARFAVWWAVLVFGALWLATKRYRVVSC